MLRPLPSARLRVILFPRKPSALPLVEDVLDEVLAECGVDFSSTILVGARDLRYVLCEG